jgi:DNA ligase D-like protein (predicted ligase)
VKEEDFHLVDTKDLRVLPSARLKFLEPMYARSVQKLPDGREWRYEIKFDGYRCLAGKRQDGAALWSRRENLFTKQFPRIAKACEKLKPNTLVDGEIVALDGNGRASFNLLQHHRSKASAIWYYAFDLIIYRGKSLLNVPLESRRELLAEALGDVGGGDGPVRLSEVFAGDPANLVAAATELGFEGVIAKRKESYYEPGKRSGAWVKYRINQGQEFVVGGYTPGNPFDALVVGYYEGDKLFYVAKVRNGFVPQVRRQVASKLKGLEIDTCPFVNLPEKKRTQWALTKEEMKNCRWLRPELVAQIEFGEWTPDGHHLRHSKFIGLREDKDPRDVVREALDRATSAGL